MPFERENLGPEVRIGVLQHVSEVQFASSGPMEIRSNEGVKLGGLTCGERYHAVVMEAQAGKSVYRIRLDVFRTDEQAKAFLRESSNLVSPGVVKTAGRTVCWEGNLVSDNREYWAMVGEYPTEQAAEPDFERLLSKFPQAVIMSDRIEKASGKVCLQTESRDLIAECPNGLRIVPVSPETSRIAIYDVIVGIQFHWEHKETQAFRGSIHFVVDNKGLLTVVNQVSIEEYLYSVNSSEMLSVCPEELLKAQTICARNTVLATVGRHHVDDAFDVCADDHCQCYRGSTRESPRSVKAVNQTIGEVLTHNGRVCDTRYAKICGGIMEPADNVWWDGDIPYLRRGKDAEPEVAGNIQYIESEETAREWIDHSPDVFCNTRVDELPEELSYARKYFRWTVEYSRQEVETLLLERADVDVGKVTDLVCLERGPSGRIIWLEVVGTRGRKTIGKELAIRRALSSSHLYSSAFYVEKREVTDGIPERFILHGAGWGHGVGMCQIGAAVMAHRGYQYGEILAHYYGDTKLQRLFGQPSDRFPKGDELMAPHADLKDLQCWEVLNCYDAAECPVVKLNKGGKCWEILDTHCFGEIQDTWEKKTKTCQTCVFYRMKTQNRTESI